MTQNIQELLSNLFNDETLLYAVLSSPKNKSQTTQKITIRPVKIKQNIHYQITEQRDQKAIHTNFSAEKCRDFINTNFEQNFKQALFCTDNCDYHVLTSKKGHITILKKSPTHKSQSISHNREKQYLLQEGTPIPFLIELGIMTQEGKVIAKKRDKFRQLNRFLEMIADILPHLKKNQTLQIIDFGCGKAYLTFALYHYLSVIHGFDLQIHGLDLKEDVIQFCQALAEKLKFKSLQFTVGDIQHFKHTGKIDLVIALHACDIATDIAIAHAVKWEADVIMCVPCCQKELFKQIHNDTLTPILKHGILKERFAAIATDAARAQLLDIAGYQTQVLEFIDLEHTPKNLLIRAVRQTKPTQSHSKAIQEYKEFAKNLELTPFLEKYLSPFC